MNFISIMCTHSYLPVRVSTQTGIGIGQFYENTQRG